MNDIDLTKEVIATLEEYRQDDDNGNYDVFDFAVEKLKKQIPKKPVLVAPGEGFRCPTCENHRSWKDGHFCKDCGQRLEW